MAGRRFREVVKYVAPTVNIAVVAGRVGRIGVILFVGAKPDGGERFVEVAFRGRGAVQADVVLKHPAEIHRIGGLSRRPAGEEMGSKLIQRA